MTFPENRNEKGEDYAAFAAEMLQLAKRPEMRPFLASTEAARQAKEKERDEEIERQRKEAEAIEQAKRSVAICEWFDREMLARVPDLFMEFQATKNRKVLSKEKWRLTTKDGIGDVEGYLPMRFTLCRIFHRGKLQVQARLVWDPMKKISSLIIQPGA